MFPAFILGLVIFAVVLWKDPKTLRINLDVIKTFLTLMVLLTFFRLFIFSLSKTFLGISIADVNGGFADIEFWRLGLVFWEDAFFAIPIYYMADKWKWKEYIWLPIAAALSVYFAQGHMYQFELAYLFALIIPYTIFYRFGKMYGFGTTMICHILFDMITILTFKISLFVV